MAPLFRDGTVLVVCLPQRSFGHSTATLVARPALLVLLSATVGCVKGPQPYAPHACGQTDLSGCIIEDVKVVGNAKLPTSDITQRIATAESSHPFGGILENVPILSLFDRLAVEYELFDPSVLARDLARVERIYRAHGYYDAHARAARVLKLPDGRVQVEIVVDEGKPVVVSKREVQWGTLSPSKDEIKSVDDRLEREKAVPVKKPLTEAGLDEAKRVLKRRLTNQGYAYAKVDAHADVDLGKRQAVVTFKVDSGPRCTFGPVTFKGLGDLPEGRLRAAVGFKEGDTFSTTKLEASERDILAFGVLGSVEAVPDLSATGPNRPTVIPVTFQATTILLRATKAGGGFDLGSRVEGHLVFGWENQNFLGGLRRFSIEARPGVIDDPLNLGTLLSPSAWATAKPLPELRLHAELTQPGFIEAHTRGRLTVAANAYRLITGETDFERIGYLELAGKGGVEREFWERHVTIGLYGSFQADEPFSYRRFGPLPAVIGFTGITIPYIQALSTLDLRYGYGERPKPDSINPHSGVYVSTDAQLGWADTQDVRIRPDFRGYIPLGKRMTLALRLSLGFLFPYGGALETLRGCDPKDSSCGRYLQLLQFRGFMSGGPNSNRGYGYNGVGPHAVVTYLSPAAPTLGNAPLPIATGGTGLWESSVELRMRFNETFGAAVFLEGSDVAAKIESMNLVRAPHLSTGIGFRYITPIGPLRADLGLRIPGMQQRGVNCPVYDNAVSPSAPYCAPPTPDQPAVPGQYLAPTYGQAGALFGLPLALSLSLGEAF